MAIGAGSCGKFIATGHMFRRWSLIAEGRPLVWSSPGRWRRHMWTSYPSLRRRRGLSLSFGWLWVNTLILSIGRQRHYGVVSLLIGAVLESSLVRLGFVAVLLHRIVSCLSVCGVVSSCICGFVRSLLYMQNGARAVPCNNKER